MLNLKEFDVLTFDCYGTLIDWEAGILLGVRPVLDARGILATDDEILEVFAEKETFVELELNPLCKPPLPYKEVLTLTMAEMAKSFGFVPTVEELVALRNSLQHWPVFADSVEALKVLKSRFKLGVLSNVDDDLFAFSNKKLQVEFDWVVTAEQVGSYKPNHRNFEVMLERVGLPMERILHVAQSLHHDIRPASELGFDTVWINRRGTRPGAGATAPAVAMPDLELPSLQAFVDLLE